MSDRNCPKCGGGLAPQFARLKMMTCPACGTSLFVQDDQFVLAGDQGVMHDAPMLFALGDTVMLEGMTFRPLGHVRYSYGRGWWDEFWALDERGAGAWISVDEGEVVVQRALDPGAWPALAAPAGLGTVITSRGTEFRVTEVETAVCDALRGELPDILTVGESHRFVNASDGREGLLSGEFWEGGQAWFAGRWFDPFDLRRVGA